MSEAPPKVISHANKGWWGLQKRRAKTLWLAGSVYRQVQSCRKRTKGLPREASSKEWLQFHATVAQQIRVHIEENKGLLIKACQFLSARPDILPEAYIREFSLLTDQLPESPMNEIRRVLRTDLGRPIGDVFEDFHTPAIGSASIAQVHRAVLRSGGTVAVKVQHEGVDRLIKEDLGTLEIIVNQVAKREPNFDLRPLLQELRTTHPRELDFLAERDALERARATLGSFGSPVIVPRTHGALCARRVLTMEFIEAAPLLSFSSASVRAEHNIDSRLILESIVDAFGIMIFRDGFFHADPHPGNFLLRLQPDSPAGAIPVLLDFGLVRELSSDEQFNLSRTIDAMARGDIAALFKALGRLGYKLDKSVFTKEKRQELMEFAASLKSKGHERKPLPRIIDDWPGVVVTVMRAVSSLEGLAITLAANTNMQKIIARFATHARAKLDAPPPARL